MDINIIIALIGTGTTFVAGMAGFAFGGKRRKAEVTSIELDNMMKALNSWKELVEYQTNEIICLRKEIADLRDAIKSNYDKISALEDIIKKNHNQD
jgi:hypothetical protein